MAKLFITLLSFFGCLFLSYIYLPGFANDIAFVVKGMPIYWGFIMATAAGALAFKSVSG